jgi:signal transduction histidine kinase
VSKPDLRVLVVDDHDDNLILLKMVLEARGLSCLTATDGLKGLTIAQAERPDLILLDLEMPIMDGFTMLEALKADSRTRGIPVIILTATYLQPNSVERGLDLGADEYLTKPINTEELLVRIRSVIRTRKAERELQQLRKDLASMLVHDLRSPLEGIGIALNVILTQNLPSTDSKQLVSMARDQIQGLSTMVEELVEFHRVESGMAVAAEPLRPQELVAEVVAESTLVAQDKGLALVSDMTEGVPMLMGDRRILKRVLGNLVSNALKFTHDGQVVLRACLQDHMVRFEVVDTGPGIPADELDRIFDKYFHIRRRKERPEHGFGLGLAFCKFAIEEHGGKIGVTSELGHGSTFWVMLPLAPVAQVSNAIR